MSIFINYDTDLYDALRFSVSDLFSAKHVCIKVAAFVVRRLQKWFFCCGL